MNDFEDILDDYLNFSNGKVDGGNTQALRQEVRVLTQPSVAYQNQLLNNKITRGIERAANLPYNITNKYLNSNLPGAKRLNGISTNPGQSWANAVTAERTPIATNTTQTNNLASEFVSKVDNKIAKGKSLDSVIAKRASNLNDPSAVKPLTDIYNEYKSPEGLSKQSRKYIKDNGIFTNKDDLRETRWGSKDALKGTQTATDYLKGGLGAAAVGGLVSGGLTLAQTHDIKEAAKSGTAGAAIGAGAYVGNMAIQKGATNLLEKGLQKGAGSVAGKTARGVSKVLLGKKGMSTAMEEAIKTGTKASTKVAGKAASKVVPFVGGALTVGMAANDIRKDLQRSDQYWKSKKTGKAAKWIRTTLNGVAAAGGVVSLIPVGGQVVGAAVSFVADAGNMLGQAFNLWSTENEEVKTADLHTQI